ncbi:MAG: BTAD domain-containing putative transcriptional regulator [Gemmatimonadota bacterium]
MRRIAADVFLRAAEEAKQQNDLVTAAANGHRCAQLVAQDEITTRRLMEFFNAIDNRGAALEVYDTLTRRLHEFGTEPSRSTRDLANHIRRGDDLSTLQEIPPIVAHRPSLPRPAALSLHKIIPSKVALVLVGLFAAVLAAWGVGNRHNADAPESKPIVMINDPVVVDGALGGLASTVMSNVSAELVAVSGLTVLTKPLMQNKRQRKPDYVIRSDVSREGGTLQIVGSVVDAESGTIVRSAAFYAPMNQASDVRNAGIDIAEFARKAMGRHLRERAQRGSAPIEINALREAARAIMRGDSLLEQGIADYALFTLDRADSILRHALVTRHTSLLFAERSKIAKEKMWVYMVPPLVDMTRATRIGAHGISLADFALRLEPRSTAAWEIRGVLTYYVWLASAQQPHIEQSRKDAERSLRAALEVNPNAARVWGALSLMQSNQADFEASYWAAERAHAADTWLDADESTTARLFSAALENREFRVAERACADISRRAKNRWDTAYCRLMLTAWKDDLSNPDLVRAESIVASAGKSDVDVPYLPVLNSLLAVIRAKAGDTLGATALLATVDTGPVAGETIPFRAWALRHLGRENEARALIHKWIQERPSRRSWILRSARFAEL